jgi:uncharacterized protein (DUF305 family)
MTVTAMANMGTANMANMGTRDARGGKVRWLRGALVAVIAIVALSSSACGDGGAKTSAGSEHNAQDVTFVQNMIPHHGQALTMAKLAASQAASAEVKDLASRIDAAQQPEIDKMNGWLASWGEARVDPNAPMDEHAAHRGMAGMMSDAGMSKLMAARGVEFDRMFLQMMIEHHQGAVEMASTEQQKGRSAEVRALADSIVTSQRAEASEMQKMLASG